MRFALEFGAKSLGQMPEVVSGVMGGYPEGVLEGWGRHTYLDDASKQYGVNGDSHMAPSLANGNGSLTNGIHANGVNGTASAPDGQAKSLQSIALIDCCLSDITKQTFSESAFDLYILKPPSESC